MYKISKKLSTIDKDTLYCLPINFHYKNEIKRICKRHKISVRFFLAYVIKVYFDDLRIFATDCSEV